MPSCLKECISERMWLLELRTFSNCRLLTVGDIRLLWRRTASDVLGQLAVCLVVVVTVMLSHVLVTPVFMHQFFALLAVALCTEFVGSTAIRVLRFISERAILEQDLADIVWKRQNFSWRRKGLEFRLTARPCGTACLDELVVYGSPHLQGPVARSNSGEQCLELPLYGRLCRYPLWGMSQPLLQPEIPAGLDHLMSGPEFDEEVERINCELRCSSQLFQACEWSSKAPPLLVRLLWAGLVALALGLANGDTAHPLLKFAGVSFLTLATSLIPIAICVLRVWRSDSQQCAIESVLREMNCRWKQRGIRWEHRAQGSYYKFCIVLQRGEPG